MLKSQSAEQPLVTKTELISDTVRQKYGESLFSYFDEEIYV